MFRKFEGVTHAMCQYCNAKQKQRKIARSPSEHKRFRFPKDSETQRGSSTNFIGSIREKNSTEKSDINHSVMKFFDSRAFLTYRSVPQRNFSGRDKKFSTGNRDITFLSIKFLNIWNLKLSETLDGSSRSFSVLWDKKIEGKPWYAWKFSRSQIFWN